ncbi:hypothetical protein QBC39DRAFT_372100 [Podospora conica]|nr:hypothetical protein QBC39DRAFT_372100 [Schizothecium conicum]
MPDVVPPDGSAVTVTTDAAEDVVESEAGAPEEVTLPDTGKTPDVVEPTGVPVLPEGSAVTVTTEAAEEVPGAPELAKSSDFRVDEAVSVPLEGSAVTVTIEAVEDEPELEGRLPEELRLPETGNTPDVSASPEVAVLPEGAAVAVTVPVGSSVLFGPAAVTVTVPGVSSVSDPEETLEAGDEGPGAVTVTVSGVSGRPGIPIERPIERPTDSGICGVGQARPPEVSLLSKDRPEELSADPVAMFDADKSEDTLGKMVIVTGPFRVAVAGTT